MKTNTDISNSDDVIDSRNIIERIEELEEQKSEFILNESVFADDNPSWGELADAQGEAEKKWDNTEEGEELEALTALQDELEGYAPDWKYGTTLIRDSYFEEYCKELVKDIGDLPNNLPSYIESNINWDGVADDLKVDYTSAEWDGVTYWVR
jgi:hypothetical protein